MVALVGPGWPTQPWYLPLKRWYPVLERLNLSVFLYLQDENLKTCLNLALHVFQNWNGEYRTVKMLRIGCQFLGHFLSNASLSLVWVPFYDWIRPDKPTATSESLVFNYALFLFSKTQFYCLFLCPCCNDYTSLLFSHWYSTIWTESFYSP